MIGYQHQMEVDMKPNKICKRVVLAGTYGSKVLFCEACNVVEMEIGALSLRLEAHAFHSLSVLMQEAAAKLALYAAAKSRQPYVGAGNVH